MEYLLPTACIAFAIGYFTGRENTIRLCRRLYNLGTDINLLFAEHTQKDALFADMSIKAKEVIVTGSKIVRGSW